MIVYADILIVLNIIVDYFLLLAVQKIIGRKTSVLRIISGALVGGLSSLYIFSPYSGVVAELLFKMAVCAVTVICTFGFKSRKAYFKACGIFFLVTCGYGGIMIAVWYILRPDGMLINNSVVYLDISPMILIGASVITYLLFMLFYTAFAKASKYAEKCDITVFADDSSIRIKGILDTGNSIEDIFGKSEIIIVDKSCVKSLFGNTDISSNEQLKLRYRLMPCETVSGNGLLEGYRCDNAIIEDKKKKVNLLKPILAVSKVSLRDDYSAIVNPKIFMQ